MITRRHARRGVLWAGVAVGCLGLLLAALSTFGTIQYLGRWQDLTIGRGAIVVRFRSTERTKVVWVPAPTAAAPQAAGDTPPAPAGASDASRRGIVYLNPSGPRPPAGFAAQRVPADPEWAFSGASGRPWRWMPVLRGDATPVGNPGSLVLPWWVLALVGALCGYGLLPAEAPPGHCPWCRFDLRKTPRLEDGKRVRCPECGRVSRVGQWPQTQE
jgi:hypothetical protein